MEFGPTYEKKRTRTDVNAYGPKVYLRTGGLELGGNLSSTIPGCTRTETYAYGFVVEFYEKYTRTDRTSRPPDRTRTHSYAYGSDRRSTFPDGSQQVFTGRQVFRENVRVQIRTRTISSEEFYKVTSIKEMVSHVINKTIHFLNSRVNSHVQE